MLGELLKIRLELATFYKNLSILEDEVLAEIERLKKENEQLKNKLNERKTDSNKSA